MDLILRRHAEADEGRPDLARRLTARGQEHAARAAAWLLQRLPPQFTVLASPAERAQQTALRPSVPFKTVQALAPGASVSEILSAADWPDREGAVIVVGHQPDLGNVAASLLCGRADGWTIRTGALWWLGNRVRYEEPQVVLRAVIEPDLL